MTPCRCISQACENPHHRKLGCTIPASIEVQSRDFGDEIIPMCEWCGVAARMSGMFHRALRKPRVGKTEIVIDKRFCG